MPKWDFNKVAKQLQSVKITLLHRCSPVNLLHIFRTSFLKNISGWLLLLYVTNSFRRQLASQTSLCYRCKSYFNITIIRTKLLPRLVIQWSCFPKHRINQIPRHKITWSKKLYLSCCSTQSYIHSLSNLHDKKG